VPETATLACARGEINPMNAAPPDGDIPLELFARRAGAKALPKQPIIRLI